MTPKEAHEHALNSLMADVKKHGVTNGPNKFRKGSKAATVHSEYTGLRTSGYLPVARFPVDVEQLRQWHREGSFKVVADRFRKPAAARYCAEDRPVSTASALLTPEEEN